MAAEATRWSVVSSAIPSAVTSCIRSALVERPRRRTTAGEPQPGDRLPSTRQLVRDQGVALATAARALAVLRAEGPAEAVPRSGTVLAGRRAARPSSTGGSMRERIVATAVELADADGLDAVSMRAVARRFDVPTMSLCGHLRDEDELVLLMIDATFAEDPFPTPPPDGWRARLEVAARVQWASYRRHPWLAQVVSPTRPQPLANLYRHAERMFQALDGHGLDLAARLELHLMLRTVVRGVAVSLESERRAAVDTGTTADEWSAAGRSPSAELLTSGAFPARAAFAEGDHAFDLDRVFEFSLRRMLDGFAVFVEH